MYRKSNTIRCFGTFFFAFREKRTKADKKVLEKRTKVGEKVLEKRTKVGKKVLEKRTKTVKRICECKTMLRNSLLRSMIRYPFSMMNHIFVSMIRVRRC